MAQYKVVGDIAHQFKLGPWLDWHVPREEFLREVCGAKGATRLA